MFGDGATDYGFLPETVPSVEQRRDIADFFFWTAWAAGTQRPGLKYSYTNNWPYEPAVGNRPSSSTYLTSMV